MTTTSRKHPSQRWIPTTPPSSCPEVCGASHSGEVEWRWFFHRRCSGLRNSCWKWGFVGSWNVSPACGMPGGEDGKVWISENTALLFIWHMGFMLELATGLFGGRGCICCKNNMMHNNVATRLSSRSSKHECIPVSHICHIACCWWTINWPTSWQLGEQTFYWMDHSWYSSYQMVQGFVHQSDLGGLLEVESFEHSNISLHHPSIDVFMWNSSKPVPKGPQNLVSRILTYTRAVAVKIDKNIKCCVNPHPIQ